MELDELKESWKKIGESSSNKSTDVTSLIKGDSKSPLVKIRSNMIKEIVIFAVVLFIMLLYDFLFAPNKSQFAFLALGVFCAVSIIISLDFYRKLFKRTKVLSSDQNILNQLSQNIDLLQSDIKNYKLLSLMMYLPALFVSILLTNESFTSIGSLQNANTNFWIIIVIYILVLFPIYYWLVNWYIKNFYLQYVNELKEMKDELEEETE